MSLRATRFVAHADRADEIDEFAEAVLVERGTSVVFRQDAFQARVVALDRDHRVIDDLADGRLLRAVLKIGPARGGRDPEDIFGAVFVGIFWIGAGVFAFARDELRMVFFETVGDVFEEDQAEDDVLVFRRVHVAAQLVGSEPELRFKADVGGGVSFVVIRTRTSHQSGGG